jgi:hypothetical protein
MFTLVTRQSLVFDETKSHVKAMGASVEIDVAVTSAGVAIAVLQKLPNGGLLVSDAFARKTTTTTSSRRKMDRRRSR